jgi:hypothetical protein
MPILNEAELFQSAAALVAAIRILTVGLARRQYGLVSFLWLTSVSLLMLSFLPPTSQNYFRVFLVFTVLIWVASFQAVRDMFSLSLSEYPGIRTAARWTLYLSLGTAFLVSAALTFSDWQRGPHGALNLYYVQVADRVIVLTLAVIIAGMLFFLSRYPLHLSRNTYVSCFFFSAVFLSQAAMDLIDTFNAKLYSTFFDTAEILICGALFLGWAFLLRQETAPPVRRVTFDDPRESDLLRQLDAINQLLNRVGRH